jgi:chromosome segregation ATPase
VLGCIVDLASSSSGGDRSIVVQEVVIAMRSLSEHAQLQQQQRQHDEQTKRLNTMIQMSSDRCVDLDQQMQHLQLQLQQKLQQSQQQEKKHAEDIRCVNGILQACQSRCASFEEQVKVVYRIGCCFVF